MKKCCRCNNYLDKDLAALNRKMLGRNIKQFFCISCLSEYLETSVEDLEEKIDIFKEQGCSLFQ